MRPTIAHVPSVPFIFLNILALHPLLAHSFVLDGLKNAELENQTSEQNSWPTNQQLYHVHIPKVGGLSFGQDALRILQKSPYRVTSREGCFSYGKNNGIKGEMIFFRAPLQHIHSMYSFCESGFNKEYRTAVHQKIAPMMPDTFSGWVQEWIQIKKKGFNGNFIPPVSMIHDAGEEISIRQRRILAWSYPPFSPVHTTLDPQDWQTLDGGGTLWHMVKMPFECYSPINLQTQRMSCEHPMNYQSGIDLNLAIDNMEKAYFVGILEVYQSSLCLLETKISNSLPPQCNCEDPEQWKQYPDHHENYNDHDRESDRATTEAANELISDDKKLYEAAWARFVREAAEVEQKFGMKILCDMTIPKIIGLSA